METENSQLTSEIASLGVCPIESSLNLSEAVIALIQQYQVLKEKQAQQWISKDLSQALIQMNEGSQGVNGESYGVNEGSQELNDEKDESPLSLTDSCLGERGPSGWSASLLKLLEQRRVVSNTTADSLNQELLSV